MVFDPVSLKNLRIRNRFVRSATYDGCAENGGYVSESQLKLFADLADGGVGLIITGLTYIHSTGQASPLQNSITGDEFIPGFKQLTQTVHDRGAKIVLQLFHSGRESKYLQNLNLLPLAPSMVEDDPYYQGQYRVVTEDEIWEIITAFGDAAGRAKEAGFDAVQLHGAYNYLFSQFLSPYTNRRNDRWGGSLENRLRIHHETYKAIRRKVGESYPIFIKLGVKDFIPKGLGFQEGKQAAVLLANYGFDSLEISHGLIDTASFARQRMNTPVPEAYFRKWCQEIKTATEIPIMMGGGLRSVSLMEEIIETGDADFITLSRPLISEPSLINDWKNNKLKKARCVSCGTCFDLIPQGVPVACVLDK